MKLKLAQISKSFDGNRVLDSVSLDLDKVHTLVLIGPSGGGKSTLLRIIAGLEHPDSGEIEINGERVVFQEEALLRHRRGIGTVFQAFNLFPHLTALENITLPLEKVHGHPTGEAAGKSRNNFWRGSGWRNTRRNVRRNYRGTAAAGGDCAGGVDQAEVAIV